MSSDKSLEVADIFRQVYPKASTYLHLSRDKMRVIRAISSCRTSELGGHINQCTHCKHQEQSYNSCWNRHCPKCQGGIAFRWVESRSSELLPVPYFHLVFTLPNELRDLCYQNKRTMYEILMRASSEALQDAVTSRFSAQAGHFGVLHTWNQELKYHPHVHHVVPAVGITDDQLAVSLGTEKFLVPVRVLSKLFRGKYIYYLKQAYNAGKLHLSGNLEYLKNPRDFEHHMSKATKHDWVVYAKRPFAGAEAVLKYLASYTHKVGISNSRLRSLTDTEVSFSARDPNNKGKKRLVKITPTQFTNRFLLHILPKGFHRIRYFGFMLNKQRKQNLATLKDQLPAINPKATTKPDPQTCSKCRQGIMKLLSLIKPHRPLQKLWFPHVPVYSTA